MARLRFFFLAAALLTAGIFSTIFYLHREPSYEGKTLSGWMEELQDASFDWQRKPAEDAIRHIGTNAIPYLLECLNPPQESPRVAKLKDWLEEHTDFRIRKPEREFFRQAMAHAAFKVLGPIAKPAIPELQKALLQYGGAADILADIGVDSIPVFTNALSSTNQVVREDAIIGLSMLGRKAEGVGPLFGALIRDTNGSVANAALFALGRIGPSANRYAAELNDMVQTNYHPIAAAVALANMGCSRQLLQMLTNGSPLIRRSCLRALKTTGNNYLSATARQSFNQLTGTVLIPVLKNVSAAVQGKALQALDFETTIILTGYLNSTNAVEREQAAQDLGFLGTKAYPAVPALCLALKDTNEAVSRSAAEALKRIDVQFVDGGIVRGPRKEKKIALEFTGHTFAEGGPTILDELAKHHAMASFFVTGDFMRNEEFKPLVARIEKDGHYLGSHSQKHLLYCSWDASKKTLISQKQFDADAQIISPEGQFWIPPYEHYNQQIADWGSKAGLTLVNYTPGTRSNADYTQESDTNFVSSQVILESILKKEREDPDGLNGFLLLMHLGAGPGRKDKFHAHFEELLDALSAKGYRFVRIDELLERKGD